MFLGKLHPHGHACMTFGTFPTLLSKIGLLMESIHQSVDSYYSLMYSDKGEREGGIVLLHV